MYAYARPLFRRYVGFIAESPSHPILGSSSRVLSPMVGAMASLRQQRAHADRSGRFWIARWINVRGADPVPARSGL